MVGCRCQRCTHLERANGYDRFPAPVAPIDEPDQNVDRRAAWARFQYLAACCLLGFMAALAGIAFMLSVLGW